MHLTYFLPKRYAPSKALLVGSVQAGTPLDAHPHQIRRRFHIPVPFRRFRMIVLMVEGDSMTLPDGEGLPQGSFVLVNLDEILSERGYVYAFQLSDGSHIIKRLNLYNGRPAIFSDNAEYSTVTLDRTIRNIGRVYAMSRDGRTWESVKYRGRP